MGALFLKSTQKTQKPHISEFLHLKGLEQKGTLPEKKVCKKKNCKIFHTMNMYEIKL